MKRCSRCKIKKKPEEFSKHQHSIGGLRRDCKICAAAYQRKYRAENPEKTKALAKKWRDVNPELKRAQLLRKKYRLSLEDFNKMLVGQRGKCAVCRDPMIKPNVDHCHVTSFVRGLLCQHCNRGLGGFRDSPQFLLLASRYLKKHLTKQKQKIERKKK